MSRAKRALLLSCVTICLGVSGCGGADPPPPLSEDLQQQIEQEDKLVADEESAM